MDLVITCNNEIELRKVITNLFEYLNKTESGNLTADNNYFKLPLEADYRYGKTKFTIFGVEIDIEIMSSNRKITFPYVRKKYIYIKF